MLRVIPFIGLLFVSFSCSSNRNLVKHSSIFVNVDLLGTNKKKIVEKFGDPFSRDIKIKNGVLMENLYYAEIIKKIMVITKFVFENENLIEQSNYNIGYENLKIKELEGEIKRNRLRSIRNRGLKN